MEIRKELLDIKCPVYITQNVIAGKWKLVILWHLKDEVKRFSELQKALPNIRQGYLTQQLRELEKDGIVNRKVYNVIPPKVEYSLTEIGTKFISVMEKMSEWGREYMEFIK